MLTRGPAKKVTIFINEDAQHHMATPHDTAENIQRLIPVVADMIDTGLMATSAVQMNRVQKSSLPNEGTGAR